MKIVGLSEPFNGNDIAAFVLDRKGKTRKNSLTVDKYRASSARALVATLLRSCKVQMFPAVIQEGRSNINGRSDRSTVHTHQFDLVSIGIDFDNPTQHPRNG
jgi:hypothetical protein